MKRPLHRGSALAATSLAFLLALAPARAATDAFLKLGDVPGESRDAAHEGWIDISSIQWGLQAPTSTNRARLSTLHIAKLVDAASPLLHAACASGNNFPKATLDLVRPGPRRVRYYRIVLEDVIVTSSQVSHSEPSATTNPPESLAIAFSRMTWSYTEFAPDGPALQELTAYWDLLAGSGGSSVNEPLRVSGAPSVTGGNMTLAFPATAGVSYRILGSADPAGPYVEVDRFTADATGATSTTLPAAGPRQFFLLEEVP